MNLLSTLVESPWADRIGWTLVHSVWQVAAVAAAFAVLLAMLRNRSANARYVCGCVALAAMVAAPLATFFIVRAPTLGEARSMTANRPSALVRLPTQSLLSGTNVPALSELGPQHADAAANPNSTHAPLDVRRQFAPALTTPPPRIAIAWRERLQSALPYVTAAWLVGVAILSLRPAIGLWTVRRLKRRGLAPLSEEIGRLGTRLAQQLHIRMAVEFAESALVCVPTVVGYVRPLVLLPATAVTGLSREELELVLAHELAHIRRHDYLLNLCQTLIESLLFYHPAMWWVSLQVRRERENCCDDIAVGLCGNRRTYARALWAMESHRSATSAALAASGGSLLARVRRLVSDRPGTPLVGGAGAWIAVALIMTIGAGTALMAVGAQDGQQAAGTRIANPTSESAQPAAGARLVTVSPAPATSLVGRILYSGPTPQPKSLNLPRGRGDADLYRNMNLVDESLVIGPEGGLANVIVWVRSRNIPVAPHNGPLPPATIRVKDGRFEPHVLAFWNAAPLRIVNEASHGINIRLSGGLSNINQILASGQSNDFAIARPELVPVQLTSSIHPWFLAYVLPLGHTYYSVTGPDGRFEITNLPPGEWEFGIWHERAGWLATDRLEAGRFTLKIERGKNDLGDLRAEANSFRPAGGTTNQLAATEQSAQPETRLPRGPADGPPRLAAVDRAVPDTTIKSLTFSRDGRFLAGGSGDHTVKLWESDSERGPTALAGHTAAVEAVHFTPDGKSLLSVGKEIKRWNVTDWQLAETVALETWKRPNAIRFSPDGSRLALVTMETPGYVALQHAYNAAHVAETEYRRMLEVNQQSPNSVSAADVDKAKRAWDEARLNVEGLQKGPQTSLLLVYDAGSGLVLEETSLSGFLLSVEYSPDGRSIAVGSLSSLGPDGDYRGSIRLFDAASGQQTREIPVFPASVSALAFSPDGTKLAYSGFQKVVMLNLSDGTFVKEFPGHTDAIEAIAFSPDGKLLVSGGQGPGFRMPTQWMLMSETKLWDIETGRTLWGNVGELGRVLSIAYSPGGSRFARSDGRSVLMQPWPENGQSWVQYNTETIGLGNQLSAARRASRPAPAQATPAAAAEAQREALISATRSQIKMLAATIDIHRAVQNSYPHELEDLKTRPIHIEPDRWAGPFIRPDVALSDPWGNAYRYRVPGVKSPESFDIWSIGPDGQDGTADDIGG